MFENKDNRTELSELGEFGLIDHIKNNVTIQNTSTLKGIGDDAAVLDSGNKKTVVSTDMLVEGVHFDLSYVPLRHLGYKAVAVNLSDIYAMNAEPKQITVSVALSNRFSLEAVEELYSGILLACKNYNVDLVGGDTTSSASGLVISITAIGYADEKNIVYRNGAKENQLLVVSGDLGGAYMGLQVLEREKAVFVESPQAQPDLEGNDYILERQLKPEPRADIFRMFTDMKLVPTAMIDISDGLASEILHLCTQSGVGIELYENKIPLDPQTVERAMEFGIDPTVCALSGGEDYELLFAIDLADYDKVKNNPMVTVIGHFTAKSNGYHLIAKDGSRHELKAQGWNAFK
ncbi:MAG: thiamine-phosphate kinase [Flavobacteriales bacterium]